MLLNQAVVELVVGADVELTGAAFNLPIKIDGITLSLIYKLPSSPQIQIAEKLTNHRTLLNAGLKMFLACVELENNK